jgi:hypothetical protein
MQEFDANRSNPNDLSVDFLHLDNVSRPQYQRRYIPTEKVFPNTSFILTLVMANLLYATHTPPLSLFPQPYTIHSIPTLAQQSPHIKMSENRFPRLQDKQTFTSGPWVQVPSRDAFATGTR